jgi:hypothetical protein
MTRVLQSLVAAALAAALSACATAPSSGAAQAAQWASATGFAASTATLEGDGARFEGARARGTPAQRRTVCAGFAVDASTAYEELPTPDVVLTDELAAAYEDLYRGAEACYAAASRPGSAAMRRAASLIGAGEAGLRAAARHLAALEAGGHGASPGPRGTER